MFDKYIICSLNAFENYGKYIYFESLFSNIFVMSFLKENVQVEYLIDFGNERAFIMKMS